MASFHHQSVAPDKRFAVRHTTELFAIPEEDTFLVLLKEKIATERIFDLRD